MTAAIRVAPWALGATVAATLASLATKWLVKKIQSMRYDGLDGAHQHSYSSANRGWCCTAAAGPTGAIRAMMAAGRGNHGVLHVPQFMLPRAQLPLSQCPCRRFTHAGLVSFSSNVIAAARALESARPDAFVRDPLAAALAGPTAMARAQVRQAGGAMSSFCLVGRGACITGLREAHA